jgi:hypothetical protein
MDFIGAREISSLRLRYLGFDPSQKQVLWRTKGYLARHVAEHLKICFGFSDRIAVREK